MKNIIIIIFIIIITVILKQPIFAQDDEPAYGDCQGDIYPISCTEFPTAVGLTWSSIDSAGYAVNWGSGQTDASSTQALITGLQPGRQYSFGIRPISTQQCDVTPTQLAGGTISCTPTVCGDSVKGTTEACDGTQFGGETCRSQHFESGTLACTSSCQISTSQCVACNNLSNVSFSNGINSLKLVAQGASFKCLVDANHQGPGIVCRIWDYTRGQFASTCQFNSWQGNQAAFTCTAPTSFNQYRLQAVYPQQDPYSSGPGGCDIPAITKTLDFSVIPPDSTPPQVSVQEQYQNYLNENPLSEIKVKVDCSDPGSSCDNSSYKLKRFDSQPVACPTDYSQYNLSSPDTPAASKTVWYCAAAKDNLGNTGFSQPLAVNPGCRDECQSESDHICKDTVPYTYGYQDSTRCDNHFDSDVCFEYGDRQRCAEYACDGGICRASSSAPFAYGNIWYDQNGDGQRIGEPGIDGIRVNYNTGSSRSREENVAYSYADGYFPMTAQNNDNPAITAVTPVGWQLTKTICTVSQKTCLREDEDGNCTEYGPCTLIDSSSGATCSLPKLGFSYYTEDHGYCSRPTVAFGFSKTDTTPPTFTSLTVDPPDPLTSQQVSITAIVTDNAGLHQMEIYFDGGLIKRCDFGSRYAAQQGSRDCSLTGGPYSAGSHQVYAKAWDNANNLTTSASQTFTVTTPPPSVTGCATGAPARATGLVSTPDLRTDSKFAVSSSGACLIDPKASFVPFKIPTFADLKSLYFDQSKSERKTTLADSPNHGTLNSALAPDDLDRIFYIDGSLTLDQSPFSGRARNAPVVIFVKDNLNISIDISYAAADANGGLVLVAGGDVNIAPSVSTVHAVIIAQGTIYTGANADNSCSTSSVSASVLTINGSLVSLNPDKPIKFCRTLADNSNPAEKINQQIKYLVILRNLMSDTYQKWSEIP